jgi:hypothetical protein
MKLISVILIICVFSSCKNNETEKDVFDNPIIEGVENMTFEERIKREMEAKLSIPVTEKYEIKIYKAHLNRDEKEDAIITVNRLNFAINEASKEGSPAKRAELGYMGNYNHFFYYDGKLDKISIPMTVASSAKSPLKVKFNNIQSDIYKDVSIEYRIRNSAFQNYYLIESGSLIMVFQWKLFDQVGLDSYEANHIEYETGTLSLAKDILIYRGKIKDYSKNIPNVYDYDPKIEKGGPLLYRFFYDPKTAKYMTNQLNN